VGTDCQRRGERVNGGAKRAGAWNWDQGEPAGAGLAAWADVADVGPIALVSVGPHADT